MIVAALAAIWTGAVFGRLAYLQLFRYSEYYSRAQHQQRLIVDVGASRAEIFDRNMNPLAMSVPVDSAFAVPSEIADPDMVARLIGKVLDVPSDEIATRIASSHSFAWIARKLPPEKANRIAAMNLRGIYFQREGGRFYPKRELAAHVLGYVDIDEKGLGGIEYSLDDSIRSKPGKMLILADAHRRWYDSTDKAPDTGTSVVLTLDEKIQYIAEKELAQAIQDTHAKSGTVIVENPNSGELLAVANWPTFNPNAAKDSPPEARVDRAASALYEPGSVFKIVTLSAAIDQGVTNPDEVVDCQNGAIYIAGHRIRDHKAYGLLTVSQILAILERRRRDQSRLATWRAQILRLHSRVRLRAAHRRRFAGRKPREAAPPRKLDAGFGRFDFHGPGSRRDAAADDHGGVGHGQWRADRQAARRARIAPRQPGDRSRRIRAAAPRDPGDDGGVHAPHARRRCAGRHGQDGASWMATLRREKPARRRNTIRRRGVIPLTI